MQPEEDLSDTVGVQQDAHAPQMRPGFHGSFAADQVPFTALEGVAEQL